MKIIGYQLGLFRLGMIIFFLLFIILALYTALTQDKQQKSHLRILHLEQIHSAVTDYLRDHSEADKNWPAIFIAGDATTSIWCQSLSQTVPLFDLASEIKAYLYKFPVDPDEQKVGSSGYYLQRLNNDWHYGSCNQ